MVEQKNITKLEADHKKDRRKKKVILILFIISMLIVEIGGIFFAPIVIYFVIVSIVVPCPFLYLLFFQESNPEYKWPDQSQSLDLCQRRKARFFQH